MIAVRNLLDIDHRTVLHNLGYHEDSEPQTRVTSLVDEYIDHASDLVDPLYSMVVRDVERVEGNLSFIEGQIIFESNVISRLLQPCSQVAIFVLTIGNRLEDMVNHLVKEGLIFQATVLDAIGSAAVESLANSVQERIDEIAAGQGQCISRRFSPGYCDWRIGQQQEVFQAMETDHAGVYLNEKCLMIPQKSISGVIGLGPCGIVDNYNPCHTCNKNDCIGRR